MIFIDGIIYSLQANGGISVYFNELFSRAVHLNYNIKLQIYEQNSFYKTNNASSKVDNKILRFGERYRKCETTDNIKLFHSSYYRLPYSKKIPVVTTVHDFTYERCTSGPRRWLHSWQKFKAIRKSDAIICISNSTKNDLLELMPDIDTSRIFVIHNGVSDAFYPISNLINTQNGPPFILFVGARSWYKNFKSVVIALSLLHDIKLICVGGGSFSILENELLNKYLPFRYNHVGYINNHELNYLYNTALCLVYPSSYEGFGIPILEAMRASCPVIALNSSSIPEVAGEAAILLDSVDPDSISASILLTTKSNIRSSLISKGIARSHFFSWEQTFVNTIAIYKSMLGKDL